jgi:predicted O-methyltransferase YrrM
MTTVQNFPKEHPPCDEIVNLSNALGKITITSTSMGAILACTEHKHALSLDLVGIIPREERVFVPSAEGWMSDEEMHAIYELAIGLPEEMGILLEVGSWKGRSASALALASPVICVDTFNGVLAESKEEAEKKSVTNETFGAFMKNIDSVGLRHRVIVLRGDSKSILPTLKGTQIRLALIDGSHDYEDVKVDIENVWALLSDGAFLIMDDYDWPGVRKACDEFSEKTGSIFQHVTGKLATTIKFASEEKVAEVVDAAK